MRALWLGLWLLSIPCFAQDNWRDASMPHQTVGIRQVLDDEISDSLIAVGLITEVGDYGTLSMLRYRSGRWSTFGTASGWVYTAVHYGDTLVVGGNLRAVDGITVSRIAAFFNGQWHPFGTFGDIGEDLGNWSIRKLRVLDGTLYAVGSFEFADGHLCNGIARRENGQWVNVGNLVDNGGDPILVDVIAYQGDIYACGSVCVAPSNNCGIIRFDGTAWSAPGGGILGGVGSGLCMAIYQDELVVGGSIYRGAGNAGHMIMRWNGQEWLGLGGHLRDQNNDTIGAARCYALLPYADKLLVAGGFWYAGGVPASRFAIWDGTNWCGTGDEWEGYGESLTIFDDTLFMASGYEVNGNPVNRVAKWVGGAIAGNTCTSVSLGEPAAPKPPAIIMDSGGGHFILRTGLLAPWSLTIVDAQGRVIRSERTTGSGEQPIDLTGQPPGLYSIILKYPNAPPEALRVVRP